MGKILIKLFCSLLLALPSAYADEVVGTDGLEGTGSKEPTGTYTTPAVQDSADNAKGQNSGAQTMSYLMGGMFIATGTPMVSGCPSPSCPVGIMLIGMGIMSFMQGDSNGDSAGQAAGTSGLTNSYGTHSTGGGTKPPSSTVKAVEAQVKALEKAGILDSKTGTIKVPNSDKKYKVTDFADAAAMAAAGFPPGAISGAMNAAARAEKSAREKAIKLGAMTAANGYAEGGGGAGGGSGGLAAAGDYNAGLGAGAGGGAGKLNRDPAQVAGMQKNFNGEPIGVAADSIFLMMKRRYKVKEGQDSFFTDMDLRIQK